MSVAMFRTLLTIAVMLLVPAAAGAASTAADAGALEAAVRDLCDRDVALLGEADHGDGRTVEFKVALVEALVTRCGYNAVFFEASHYDFLEFSRRARLGQAVTPAMVSSAIGGLWNFDRELAPLVPFLFARAQSGRLALGGLDDQLGGLGSFYANDGMPAALAGYLPPSRRAECQELLRRRAGWAAGVRSEPERSRALRCLADISSAARRGRDRTTRAAHLGMLASVARLVARDTFFAGGSMDTNGYIRARDRSMYLNFRALADRLPPHRRIIVWAANNHIAKDATMTSDYAGSRNLGSFIREAYGRRAFALGFSARAGAHFWTRQEPSRPFAAAGPDSLEARAIEDGDADTFYLGPARLAALGAVPGSLFRHEPLTARWGEVVDGVIVFRAERAPVRTD
jgi:erythromycin esterase-like protein